MMLIVYTPFVALNDMPGTNCTYMEYYDNSEYSLDKLFGFFYCKVSIDSNNYLGLLPLRDSKLGLIFPLGEWTGW